MSKPGQWKWYWQQRQIEGGGLEAECGVYYEKREGQAYAICRAPRYATREEWEANARLIAAAPDLLAALLAYRAKFGHCGDVAERADAAIAKAKGEPSTGPQ